MHEEYLYYLEYKVDKYIYKQHDDDDNHDVPDVYGACDDEMLELIVKSLNRGSDGCCISIDEIKNTQAWLRYLEYKANKYISEHYKDYYECEYYYDNYDGPKGYRVSIDKVKNTKAWFINRMQSTHLSDFYQSEYDDYDFENEEFLKLGDIYFFEESHDYYTPEISIVLCENYAGFIEKSDDWWRKLEIKEEKLNFLPEANIALMRLKIHPELRKYYEFDHKGQIYYIFQKEDCCVLYNADFKKIIDEKFNAEKIIPFKDTARDNELIIIKSNNIGIYYIDTDTIRWGYKGAIDDNIDWFDKVCVWCPALADLNWCVDNKN